MTTMTQSLPVPPLNVADARLKAALLGQVPLSRSVRSAITASAFESLTYLADVIDSGQMDDLPLTHWKAPYEQYVATEAALKDVLRKHPRIARFELHTIAALGRADAEFLLAFVETRTQEQNRLLPSIPFVIGRPETPQR